jgi:soluble lytic murein transglycosylase-like protein
MNEIYENGPIGVQEPKRRMHEKLTWPATVLLFAGSLGGLIGIVRAERPRVTEAAPVIAQEAVPSNSFYQAARVFGKAGCGDAKLADTVAKYSEKSGVDANILAAVIAVESHCDPLAVSSKGAVGIMQVMPRVWNSEYNFSEVNLLNPEENIQVGSEILGGLTRANSPKMALSKYNGTGEQAMLYAEKVLALAK